MSTLAVPAQRARAPVPTQRHTADTPWSLVEQAQAGDMDAWVAIWRANHDRIQRFIRSRVRGKELTEDLTSEVFTKALARLAGIDWQGRDIGAWLITVARNLVADYYKSGRYRLETVQDDFTRDVDEADPDTPADAAEHTEVAAILDAALAQLTADQREVIVLRYLRGLSVEEAAAAVGKEQGAVKALTYRAVRALAQMPAVAALRGDR